MTLVSDQLSPLVAVTGGSGFIGVHAVRALALAGYRLRLLTRVLPTHPALADIRFEAVLGDLGDDAALDRLTRGADAVVHLAGVVKAINRAAFISTNATGTEIVARAASANGVGRFVLVSSLAAREPALSAYAYSKREAEKYLAKAAGDMEWIVIRPAAVYGPWDREGLAIFRAAQSGIAPILGSADARIGFIEVGDVVSAILMALTSGAAGTIYEIDDRTPGGYSWEILIAAASRAVKKQPLLLRIPRGLFRLFCGMADLCGKVTGHPTLLGNGKVFEILHHDWVAKAMPELPGWVPRCTVERGFAETVDWYLAKGWLKQP